MRLRGPRIGVDIASLALLYQRRDLLDPRVFKLLSLTILLTKDEVTGFIDTVPIIDTNEAITQLLINDGDTIVIGGIIKNKEAKDKDAFPGLHKIPVLGWMFQSNREEITNKELLIFLNPKIVQLEQRAALY